MFPIVGFKRLCGGMQKNVRQYKQPDGHGLRFVDLTEHFVDWYQEVR